MDKFDKQILSLLMNNARLTVSQISREVNLSRSATADRIRAMEHQGVISGYHAHLTTTSSHTICAYFELDATNHDSDINATLLREIPEIRYCHAISGQVDMIAFVEAESVARLDAIREQLESMEQMATVRTHMVLKEMFRR